MASSESTILKLTPSPPDYAYRSAPHNIEAEQSLLGAILVNNDAFYRVSDFLEPKHFFEPIHQTIYETAGSLIRMGKVATPVTLKTFLPALLLPAWHVRPGIGRGTAKSKHHVNTRSETAHRRASY